MMSARAKRAGNDKETILPRLLHIIHPISDGLLLPPDLRSASVCELQGHGGAGRA